LLIGSLAHWLICAIFWHFSSCFALASGSFGSLALICSLAHLLSAHLGLLGSSAHLLIRSLAHLRHFLAFLLSLASGSLAPWRSFTHWLILAHWLISASLAHLLICSFGLICSLAPWLVGSLAYLRHSWHFSSFTALASGSLAPWPSFARWLICSFAHHLGLIGSSAQWLLGSLAYLCLFWHLAFFGVCLFWHFCLFWHLAFFGLSRAFLLSPQDLRVSGLYNL